MKKILSLSITAFILVSLLGCSQSKEITTGDKSKETTEESKLETKIIPGTLPLSKENVTLSYACPEAAVSSMAPPSNDLPVYQYLEKLTNVRVDWQATPTASYNEVMTARVASGQKLPDMFHTFGANPAKLYNDGIIITIEDLIDEYGFYTKKFMQTEGNQLYKVMLTSPDSHVYGLGGTVLPNNLTQGYMINMPWLQKLGLAVPETTDQFYEVLKAFKNNDMNDNGKLDSIPLSTRWTLSQLGDSFGLNLQGSFGTGYNVGADGKVYAEWITPKYKEFLSYVKKLYDEGLLDSNYAKSGFDEINEFVTQNRAGVIMTWETFSAPFSALSPLANDPSGNTPVFVPMPPPKGPYGDQYKMRRIQGGPTWFISSSCKDPVLAFRWMDFLFGSPEAEETQVWGIEDITFKWENGKRVQIISKEGEEWQAKLQEIGGGQPPRAHRQMYDAWKISVPEWVLEADSKLQKYYKNPNIIAIEWTLEESNELKEINSDIGTYISEMQSKFISGAEPLERFDDYVKNLKSMNIDAVVNLYQKRHERFLELSKGIKY